MIGKIVSFLALVAVAYAAAASRTWEDSKPFEGIDPNTLSCDPLGKEFLLLPHFEYCDKFYMCTHGQEVEFTCAPGGLYFDFERQTCNWPTATKCWRRKTDDSDAEGSGDENEFTVFGEEIENGPIGDLTAESSGTVRPMAALSARQANNAASLNCNLPLSAARQVPYKGDCQRYWRCVSGVPQTAICTDGLFFNEATMQCDHEANVRCAVQITEELNGEFMVYE